MHCVNMWFQSLLNSSRRFRCCERCSARYWTGNHSNTKMVNLKYCIKLWIGALPDYCRQRMINTRRAWISPASTNRLFSCVYRVSFSKTICGLAAILATQHAWYLTIHSSSFIDCFAKMHAWTERVCTVASLWPFVAPKKAADRSSPSWVPNCQNFTGGSRLYMLIDSRFGTDTF